MLGIEGGVDATALALGGSDEALAGTLGIRGFVDRERVMARLGEGERMHASHQSRRPARDRFVLM